eukprot:1725873-Alexandrium_andersonii.AAC.1
MTAMLLCMGALADPYQAPVLGGAPAELGRSAPLARDASGFGRPPGTTLEGQRRVTQLHHALPHLFR